MSEENSNKDNDVFSEVFGSKLDLKKILKTYIQVFRNVHTVVEDVIRDKGNYTKPVKYTLSIIAPYVIIIQVLNLNISSFIVNESKTDLSEDVYQNPDVMQFYDKYLEVTEGFTALQFEFLPVWYAVVYVPILAFWIKIFFKEKNLRFSYYYSLATYLVMTIITITLALFLMSYYGLFDFNSLMLATQIIIAIFLTYGLYLTFQQNIIKTFFKSIFVFLLALISNSIPIVVIITVITILTM